MKPPQNNSKRAPLSPLDNFKAILFHNASVFSKSGNTSPLSADSGIINGFASGGTSDSNSCSFSELSSPEVASGNRCFDNPGNGTFAVANVNMMKNNSGNVTPTGDNFKTKCGGPKRVGSPLEKKLIPKCTTTDADNANLYFQQIHKRSSASFDVTDAKVTNLERHSIVLNGNETSNGTMTPITIFSNDITSTAFMATSNNSFCKRSSLCLTPDASKFYPISVDNRFQPITKRVDSPLGHKPKCKSACATPVDSGNRDSRRFSGSSFNGFNSPNGNTRRYGELAHWRCSKR